MNNEIKNINEKFCTECGKIINCNAKICLNCGVAQILKPKQTQQKRTKTVAVILAIFFVGFGAHWFYLGEKNRALIYLTAGIVSIFLSILTVGFGALITVPIWTGLMIYDIIMLLSKDDDLFDELYNE